MSIKLRPLHEQVLFITGASSGVGLTTVHLAVEKGAKVFMVARNRDELERIQIDLSAKGYEVESSAIDVADMDQLKAAVDKCISIFGRIDTFVNNAGVTLFSKILDTNILEAKRLFETNYWGMVIGCKVVIPHLKDKGGVIINLGSFLSDLNDPSQPFYVSSKCAEKSFFDILRNEISIEKLPIHLSLIVLPSINSPMLDHALAHNCQPAFLPPVYDVKIVAEMILKMAVNPLREIRIGSLGHVIPNVGKFFPNLTNRVLRSFYQKNKYITQRLIESNTEKNLFHFPSNEGMERGYFETYVIKNSLLVDLALRKIPTKFTLIVAGVYFLFNRVKKRQF